VNISQSLLLIVAKTAGMDVLWRNYVTVTLYVYRSVIYTVL